MEHAADTALVTLDEIRAAAERIAGVAIRTPLLPFREGWLLKPEGLQPTGSFKIRGAYNALLQLTPAEKANGVVTHSSGNHAQAIARAARLLGIRAVVVMPEDAPAIKVAGVRADGAEIVFVGRPNQERVDRAHEIAHRDGLHLVSSANDERIICGQGTIGLEIIEQLAQAALDDPPTVLVPIGLGGLSAGVATAVKALRGDAQVLGVEPELAADTQASLDKGTIVAWSAADTGRTMADGMRGEAPAPIPFAHLRAYLDGVLTVSEGEIAAAVAVGAREAGLVLEPSGATSLAALLAHGSQMRPGPVVAILSGSNVDPDKYIGLLQSSPR